MGERFKGGMEFFLLKMEKLNLIEQQNTIFTSLRGQTVSTKKNRLDRIELKNDHEKKEDNRKVFTTLFTTKEKTLSNSLKDRVLTFLFVVPPGIEPGTQGFSVLCSTN